MYSRAKAVVKEVLQTGSIIITDVLNKDPDQPLGDILKNRFSEAKDNLEQKIKTMTASRLSLKRKRMSKNAQSQNKRRKVKDNFTEKQ